MATIDWKRVDLPEVNILAETYTGIDATAQTIIKRPIAKMRIIGISGIIDPYSKDKYYL